MKWDDEYTPLTKEPVFKLVAWIWGIVIAVIVLFCLVALSVA